LQQTTEQLISEETTFAVGSGENAETMGREDSGASLGWMPARKIPVSAGSSPTLSYLTAI
jgi:hypothetical protein